MKHSTATVNNRGKQFELLLQFSLLCRQMRRFSLLKKLTSFFLLLVFLQKTGGGLIIHNELHGKITHCEIPRTLNGSTITSANCSCIDDFMMPFAEAEEIVMPATPLNHPEPDSYFSEHLYFRSHIFSSLRAPPFA